MVDAKDVLLFGLAALMMVLVPGPNMMYLVSRALCQGKRAAVYSLLGVAVGFVFHMLLAALGLTVLFLAIPVAYQILKLAGAAYLLWLAWQAVRPGAPNFFETRELPAHSRLQLFGMGLLTNILNPKIAVFYVSIFTQFLRPERGSTFAQALILGATQIAVSVSVNFLIISSAHAASRWLTRHPLWIRVQKWFMGAVLAGLAVRLAASEKP